MSKWQPQDIVRDAEDKVWVRSAEGRNDWAIVTYLPGYSGDSDFDRNVWYPRKRLASPLTLLVRHGWGAEL